MLVIRDYCGVDFSYYKENTLVRRLERRLGVNRVSTINQYIKFLQESDAEKEVLFREFLIGVTRFFRDQDAFEELVEIALKKIIKSSHDDVRIWSVGCSTGEEAYSVAIMLEEVMSMLNISKNYKIFATDIDKRSIEYASSGFYSDSLLSDIEKEKLERYFNKKDGGWQIKDQIRQKIIFAPHNVLKDPPFSKLDLITCRNLFIYFKPESQERILNRFYLTLKPDGILFMGSSESLGGMEKAFEPLSLKHKIFERKAGYRAPLLTENYQNDKLSISREKTEYSSIAAGERKRSILMDAALKTILPPSVIVDDSLIIYQVFNNINPFLEIQAGSFSQNLASVLNKEATMLVNNIVRKLKSGSPSVIYDNVTLEVNSVKRLIDMKGVTIDKKEASHYFLISFVEKDPNQEDDDKSENYNAQEQYQRHTEELEKELQFTKENLQATVEELETSNEELQSSNEELIASNEELQSTNEELQSVNEELYTVNSEYEDKIDELTELNNDMSNLMKNTEMAALYLDKKLRIRKFTERFEELSNIQSEDIGRSIEHFDINQVYEEFTEDIKTVQISLNPVEKEILHKNGSLFLLRIVPYRTDYNAVDGVLATLIDISTVKSERIAKNEALERLQLALEMGNMAWWTWDVPSGKVDYHEKKATMIGYTYEEFPKDVYEVTNLIHPDDFETAMDQMRGHLKGMHPNYEVTYRIKTKNGSYRWYYDKGGVVERDKDGQPLFLVGIVADVTKEKLLEKQLREEGISIQNQLDQLKTPALVINEKLEVKNLNSFFAHWLKKPLNSIAGKRMTELDLKAYIGEGKEPVSEIVNYDSETVHLKHGKATLRGVLSPIEAEHTTLKFLLILR
jgi:two-component system CheB/CheR fusion protein